MLIPKELPKKIKFFDHALFFTFLIFLLLPLFGLFFKVEKKFELTEMRKFSEMPETTTATIFRKTWRLGVEDFINDNFGLRGELIKANNLIQYKIFHTVPLTKAETEIVLAEEEVTIVSGSPDEEKENSSDLPSQTAGNEINANIASPSKTEIDSLPWVEKTVIIGQEGWLYFDRQKTIDDYRGINPFTEDELLKIRENLRRKKEELEKQGIAFMIFVAPNKHTIYPEYLPDTIKQITDRTRLNQIAELAQDSGFTFIDPRDELLSEKTKNRVYLVTGTHWNEIGAFIGYQKLANQAKTIFPAINPRLRTDYREEILNIPGNDLARLLSLESEMEEDIPLLRSIKPLTQEGGSFAFKDPNDDPDKKVKVREIKNSPWPRVLFFGDSFMNALVQFVGETFSRSVFVQSYKMEPEIVAAEKPDLVVLEIVERELGSFLNLYAETEK